MKSKILLRPLVSSLFFCSSAVFIQTALAVDWDYGATTAIWADASNWNPDGVPAAGDTVNFTSTGNTPDTITLDTSYQDTGSAINLTFAYGKELAISSGATNELYINSLTVSDAHVYTLDIAKNGSQGNSGSMPQAGATWNIGTNGTLVVKTCWGAKSGATAPILNKSGDGTLKIGDGTSNAVGQYAHLNAQTGTTELGFTSGNAFKGITGISSGATVKITASNPNLTTLNSSYFYGNGVAGVAGTFALNGFDQTIASLSGTSTGVVTNGTASAATLTIGVNGVMNRNSSNGSFAGVIQDGASATLSLNLNPYNTAFVQTLTGANTYSGATTVSRGTLTLKGGSIANSALTMEDGTTLNMGDGSTTLQTISLPSLTQNGTSAIHLDLTTAEADRIDTGDYTYSGGSIVVDIASQPPYLSTYTLVNYSGTLSANPTVTINGLTPGTPYSVNYGAGTNSSITVTFGAPLAWNGDVNGAWDIGATANWLNVATPSTYANTDHVVFDDNATGTTDVVLDASVTPQSVSFENSNWTYTLTGTGDITTPGTFTKSGTGSATIETPLTVQGDVVANDGYLDFINSPEFVQNNPSGSFNVGVITSGRSVIAEMSDDTTITASTFAIGQGGPGGSGTSSNASVNLGATTIIHADSVVVGDNSAQSGSSSLNTAAIGATVEIRATDGTSRADMVVGSKGTGSDYTGGSGTVDFTSSGTTLDALIGTLTLGRHGGGAGNFNNPTSGSFAFNTGTLDATSIVMGVGISPNNKTANGTLTSNGGTIKAGTLTLVQDSGGAIGTATVNLNDGAILEATTVTGQAATNAIINWNEGTLRNLAGGDLTVSNTTLKLPAAVAPRALEASGGDAYFDPGTVIDSSFYSTGSPDLGSFSVTGALTLTDVSLTLHDLDGAPAAMTAGTKLVLIDYSAGSLTGTFDGIADGDSIAVGPNVFEIDYDDPTYSGTAVTLTALVTTTPFEDWLITKGVTPGDPNTAPEEDYDADGLANMVEYVLDTNPNGGTQESLPVSVKSGTDLVVTFTRLTEAGTAGFTSEVEYSETLDGSWTTATAGMIGVVDNGTTEDITVTIPTGGADKLFARLKVTAP